MGARKSEIENRESTMFLSEVAVRRPVTTIMFFLSILILGVISLTRLSVDLLPDISFPNLTIWTSYPDVPPVEVEELVTAPIEETVNTIPRVRRVNSVSKEGVSLVTLEFLWGTDMDIAALNVREKLDNLRWNLPQEAGRPSILRLDPRSQPIMSLSVTGGDLLQLKELARNVFKRRLEQIQGVALANVTGGFEREIQVEVESRKLSALGISIEQVALALATANRNLPGGTRKKGRYRYALRTLGEFHDVREMEEVIISRNGAGLIVPLKDVAEVIDGFRERDAITRFNGKEAIGIIVTKEAGSNSVEVSKNVRTVLQRLREEYPEVEISVAADQAQFISEAISNVLQAVIWGGVLAFIVLFFFLNELQSPIAIATAIPIAILAAFAMMFFSGVSLNMISLGGLALGVGMLVDNSIVVLENIFRHREEGADVVTASIQGAHKVAMPVLASTLTTVAVFFPIIYVKGVAGQLFRDQSLTVSYSLLASLLVALTLLPMLAARFARRSTHEKKETVAEFAETQLFSPLFKAKRKTSFSSLQLFYPIKLVGGLIRKAFRFLWKWLAALMNFWKESISEGARELTNPMFATFERWFKIFAQNYERLLNFALNHPGKVL
ncbi:MAG: efflux RND transporter permease subunit, partial [bacterium]